MIDLRISFNRRSVILSSLLGTMYLVFLILLSARGGYLGYAAGLGDHTVLFAQGIQWVDSSAFQNDWFLHAAPQPHWFFDLIIAFGTFTNSVDALLFAFWMLGLCAFVVATILFAKIASPKRPFLASFLVITLAGISPWMYFGTGTPIIGMALPTVLTSSFIYLIVVFLLRRNYTSASILSVIVGLTHVQQGAVVAVILTATLITQWLVTKKLQLALISGLAGTIGFVILGLQLRPVASNLSDFVEVCNAIIPYHCSAFMWPRVVQAGVVGGIILAAATFFIIKRSQRLLWLATAGLVILGLGLGFIADALRIPFFGELAQAVNVYRLGAVAFPFLLWGIIWPALKTRGLSDRHGRKWIRPAMILLWIGAIVLTFVDPVWGVSGTVQLFPLETLMFTVVFLVLLALSFGVRRTWTTWVLVIGVTSGLIVSAVVMGTIRATPVVNWYAAGDPGAIKSWFYQIRDAVPPGEVITAPGTSADLRLHSQRATIADCKNVPYGGEAWAEWNRRVQDLGINCQNLVSYGPNMSLPDFETLARKYGSEFVIFEPEFVAQNLELLELEDWQLLVGPNGFANGSLYRLPSD